MHKLGTELQALIKKECKGKAHIKLTVGILADGKQTIQTFGASGEVPNENYVYEIGSITKTFTTSLLAKYIYEGKMSLNDSIAKYVDGLDSSYYPTLKRLATHTAGYGYLPATIREGITMILLARFIGSRNGGVMPNALKVDADKMKKLLLENKKEDKDYPWAYSNFGIGLLGYAIGQVLGKGYSATMDEFLTNELQMPNSYTGTKPDKIYMALTRKTETSATGILEKQLWQAQATSAQRLKICSNMLNYT